MMIHQVDLKTPIGGGKKITRIKIFEKPDGRQEIEFTSACEGWLSSVFFPKFTVFLAEERQLEVDYKIEIMKTPMDELTDFRFTPPIPARHLGVRSVCSVGILHVFHDIALPNNSSYDDGSWSIEFPKGSVVVFMERELK